jgi:hypothetical protein
MPKQHDSKQGFMDIRSKKRKEEAGEECLFFSG